MLVLGINRTSGKYIGAPKGSARIRAGDVLILYGRANCLENLDQRCLGAEGDHQHHDAVLEQEKVRQEEEAQDRLR